MKKLLAFIVYGILYVIDVLANVITLGHWSRTISMRLGFACYCKYVKPRYKWVRPLADFVDFLFIPIEEQHCKNAYEAHEIVNKDLWCLYVVTNQIAYDALEIKMKKSMLEGRAS